jgi:cellulose synthase/poly-beta-1,6-N-acetylglucosamine synthase-like glycosyltransferase
MVAVALTSLGIVLYTYLGYPALVLLWARFAPRSSTRSRPAFEPTVSVCLAVHNGSRYVRSKIRNLQQLEYPRQKLEILVFSDGSTDDTDETVAELARTDERIRLLSAPEHRGKPTALNRLREAATGEVLLLCDVRQLLAPGTLRALVHELSDPSVGCASGSLIQLGDTGAGVYGRYEHAIRGSESRTGSMVGVAGSIYAIRRSDMPDLPPRVLLDDMFVPLRVALSRGKRIVLADGAEAYDEACDDGHEFPRKVRTLAGNYQLIEMMPTLLVPFVNPVWFQLTSHKWLRLACPWALVALFMSSGNLACTTGGHPLWCAFFIAQVIVYLLAAIGRAAGRLGTVARTFVVLNVAAVVGLWRYVRGTQAVTWQR